MIASLILKLLSRDNLGSKQRIILHKCLIKNKRYDLVITPHKQTKGYIRSKRQTRKITIITKLKQIIKRRFPKRRNAVSESATNTIQELQVLNDSINTKNSFQIQKHFLTQELHHHHQLKENEELRNHT